MTKEPSIEAVEFAKGWQEGLEAADKFIVPPEEIIKGLERTLEQYKEANRFLQERLDRAEDRLEAAQELSKLLAREYADA